jgi:hypothetical protein
MNRLATFDMTQPELYFAYEESHATYKADRMEWRALVEGRGIASATGLHDFARIPSAEIKPAAAPPRARCCKARKHKP